MVSKYRHVGVVVRDMDKAIEFYCDLLGHKVLVELTESGDYFNDLIGMKDAAAEIVKVGAPDGSFVELIKFTTHEPIESKSLDYNMRGLNHVCFTVDDIEGLYDKLVSAGVEFVSRPLKSPFDPVKTCFCYDPDNTLVQFVQILDAEGMGWDS